LSSRLAVTVALLALAVGADADPRFWKHDRALTASSEDKSHPDIAFARVESAVGGPVYVAVVWEQEGDLWMRFSPDFGCSWCDARVWVAEPGVIESRPRTAIAIKDFGVVSIQVVYEAEGDVFAAHDATVSIADPVQACTTFQAASPATSLLSRARPTGTLDRAPQIVKSTDGFSVLHHHAVWERTDPVAATSTIEYSRDLIGDGSGWTTSIDLSAQIGASGRLPDVAADMVADSASQTAVSIFFHDPDQGGVFMVRNNQSGEPGAWSPTPIAVGQTVPSALSVDSSAFKFEGTVWNGAAWLEDGAATAYVDAAYWTGPPGVDRNPDFEAPGDLDLGATDPNGDISLSISAGFGGGPLTMLTLWTEGTGPREILIRPGVLDPTTSPPRDLDRVPEYPRREMPPDPVISAVSQLSLCRWHEATGDCVGEARTPASIAGATQVATDDVLGPAGGTPIHGAVFVDDRDGTPQIYIKFTDLQVGFALIQNAVPSCQALRTAQVQTTLDPPCQACGGSPFPPDDLERFLLYFGTTGRGGPYPERIELDADLVTDPHIELTTDLAPGTDYTVLVVPEDEARNLQPVNFDPASPANDPGFGTWAAFSTPSCEPAVILPGCGNDGARCNPGDPLDPGDPNPGETIELTLTFNNTGDWLATGLSGTIQATNADVIVPDGGDLSKLGIDVPTFGLLDVPVTLVVQNVVCPASVTVSILGLASDGGQVTYGDVDCGPLTIDIDCSQICTPTCLVPQLDAITDLQVVKAGTDDLAFVWDADPNAGEYHLNRVDDKTLLDDLLLPGSPQSKRTPIGVGTPICDVASPACTATGEQLDLVLLRYYQAYAACGPDGASEGPF